MSCSGQEDYKFAEKSYLAEATAINSIPQQLVAKVSGQSELERAQLITSSSLLNTMPPPGVSCIWPGKEAPSKPPPEGEASVALLFKEFSKNYDLIF